MKTSLTAVALVLVPLLSVGCAKKEGQGPASPGECQKTCDHVAGLKLAPLKLELLGLLHELDENIEATEKEAKVAVDRLKSELALGGPPWNEAAVQKMPAAHRRAATQQHEWAASQLKLQREQAIKAAEEGVVKARQNHANAKKDADARLAKAMAEALDACKEPCLKGTLARAQCLQRTQAIEDFTICEHP